MPRPSRGPDPERLRSEPAPRIAIPRNRGRVRIRVFGDDGQVAGATTQRELANVLAAKGDLTGAIESLQQALATQRRIVEREDAPDVAATLRRLERLQALQRDVQRPD